MPLEPPYCPPVVGPASSPVGHLLCWEGHDRDSSWQARVPARESRSSGEPQGSGEVGLGFEAHLSQVGHTWR
jgi:hypothetical protein